MEGNTLEELYEQKGGFERDELVRIGMAVCQQLSVLHNLDTPIVHRDIKPQNIIINSLGEIQLIDFDATRRFDINKGHDTHFFGTEQTAAPEQYGFAQTDARTDLYGLGKTLIYLACGSYDVSALKNTSLDNTLKNILRGSVSLLKKERPKSADAFYEQLEKYDKHIRNRLKYIMTITAAIICCAILSVFGIYRVGEYKKTRIVEFESALLESAIRQSLGIDDETPVIYDDLKRIYKIRILGSEILDKSEVGEYYYMQYDSLDYINRDGFTQKGDIIDLSLISKMPNLRELYLTNQNISDITPLRNLQLTTLVLSDNYVRDFSCISDMTSLRKLYIGNNPVSDLEFLCDNKTLAVLNINCNTVSSFVPLETTAISDLWIMDCMVIDNSYASISKIETLRSFSAHEMTDEKLSLIRDNPYIQVVNLWGDTGTNNIKSLGCMANVHTLNIGCMQFNSLEGIENFPSLRLLIPGNGIKDYTPLLKNENLSEINIFHITNPDYTVLVKHPSLRLLYCTATQNDELHSLYPDTTLKTEILD